MHELKMTAQIIIEELNKDTENLIRKNQRENLEGKIPIVKQKIQWKTTQQIRTSRRQNLRA
jgi:hypothetical protein